MIRNNSYFICIVKDINNNKLVLETLNNNILSIKNNIDLINQKIKLVKNDIIRIILNNETLIYIEKINIRNIEYLKRVLKFIYYLF
ncbi:hypothetical protein A0H76_1264 [Hepatospora eriocheir]|uniref:GLUE N-terminal domain-containing protein n=1 Tax=Hepatospora eriocheir TaxID=1081669 RepID=A0A1X0QKQ2_9MICR|nr:hypothetical protein A0H76_1264 [Hepatospora eriocheir]